MALDIPQAIGAIGSLGIAAYGLVDASKPFWGGVSRFGFGHIEASLRPFHAALDAGSRTWRVTLFHHWLNGTALEQQKAIAKSLIRLGLSPDNAESMARAGHVDPAKFHAAVVDVYQGAALTTDELNVIGRFDAAVDAALDAGYERADQKYRNSARVAAGAVAMLLAIWGGWILHPSGSAYWWSTDFMTAVWVGAVSVPLAPVAKDLASSLSAAVNGLKVVRGY